ncbi:MAG: polyprenyl synthetase family protein [Bacteroidales bacterium]|nr:polyprenyl synthetase family protein [Bacteroidales bacterium]
MYTQEELKDIVNKAILNISYEDDESDLYKPVKYILSLGGKRLRPVMTLMACNLFMDNIDEAVLPAVGLEIFHNFTLVHDDIMDDADVRRGSATVHSKWNSNQAILSGDVMAFVANECISHVSHQALPAVLKTYNRVARDVCLGQQLDMDFEKILYVTNDQYLKMVELKTAVLIAGALKIGAVIGGAGEKERELLYSFGRSLGLAFQVQDDFLDAYGDPKLVGKKTGGDILANKKTFLLVKAFEVASGEQKNRLRDLMNNKNADPDMKIREVMNIYNACLVDEYAENMAASLIEEAYVSLDQLDVEEVKKEPLRNLASHLVGRIS